ncbi:MAG: signal peptidase I [Oscillospiraceae bacterium]|nr:signal peptidase I [Oscillospiraceae bacterium]
MNNKDYEAWEQRLEEDKEPVSENQRNKPSWQKTALLYLHDLVYLLSAAIIVLLLCFRVVVVSGTSMNTTLLDGDYLLLLSNTFYHDPQYGDIIVAAKDSFKDGEPIVKRVIATEGQWVDIDFEKGIVFVSDDGMTTWRQLEEPYTNTPTNVQEGVQFPLYVEEGCLFVMGDNRNGSRDSRSPDIGLVDKREVLGKVIFLFLPGTNGTDVYGQPNEERDFGRIGVVD